MINNTTNVTVAALTQWILSHQDDSGCHEAADNLGGLEAVSTLMEMLDGPLTSRCAFNVAKALSNHADASQLPHLYRHRFEFRRVAAMLDSAIEDIEESKEDCTCCQCHDAMDSESGPDGSLHPVVPPSDHPHRRN